MGRPTNLERAQRTESREETGRSTRVPLGVSRTKMSVPERPGYVRRWVNDFEGRLQQAMQGGYKFAVDLSLQIGDADIDNENRDLGARISRVVDRTTGQKAFLMEIKEEFYKEDQAAKAAAIAETQNMIRRGTLHKVDQSVVKDDWIKIENR